MFSNIYRAAIATTLAAAIAMNATPLLSAETPKPSGNAPAAVEQLRDDGIGIFVHWGVDGSLGGVISHSLVGASADYQERYFEQLPHYFNPKQFDPDTWASLIKLAGFRYVVFTTKHHSGFCMWDTKTTSFSIMHTPYKRDLLSELIPALRKEGLKVGLYYSPDDFHWLYEHHIPINREVKGVYPQEIPDFMEYTKAQMRELLTKYGPIDYMFFDGPAEELKQYAWQLQPNIVVTRGEIETPEQYTPGVPLPGAWEANLTMGTEWPWKPTNETYKSGIELIDKIIETRAKGGNLLLNLGPKPDGIIPIEQESRLREIALWNFVNEEGITATRPWTLTNERNIWFTRAKDSNTVYAFLTNMAPWRLGDSRSVVLHSVRATSQTRITVLGQDDTVVEYQPKVNPKTTWSQQKDGLHLRVVRSQRLYTNRLWPNTVVVKITNVEPNLVPPAVETIAAGKAPSSATIILNAKLLSMGGESVLHVGFQYREKKGGVDLSEKTEPWSNLPLHLVTKTGEYSQRLTNLKPGHIYEFRAWVHHPLIETYGNEREFTENPARTQP